MTGIIVLWLDSGHKAIQGKIERWHQTLKNRILLENYFFPADLEARIEAFVVLLGFAAIVGSFLNSYTADKYDGLMAQRLQGTSYFRLGRDVRVFVIFLGAVVNLPLVTLGIVALVMNVEVVRRIIVCARADTK